MSKQLYEARKRAQFLIAEHCRAPFEFEGHLYSIDTAAQDALVRIGYFVDKVGAEGVPVHDGFGGVVNMTPGKWALFVSEYGAYVFGKVAEKKALLSQVGSKNLEELTAFISESLTENES